MTPSAPAAASERRSERAGSAGWVVAWETAMAWKDTVDDPGSTHTKRYG
jgi:hypothetical protein